MNPHSKMKVFLSYAIPDAQTARDLASSLSKAGYEVWSPEELLPGENWWSEVGRHLEDSRAMIVLLSPDSVHSPFVRREVEFALGSPRFESRLVPVMVRPTNPGDVPWILRKLRWINMEGHPPSETVNRIVEHLQGVKSEKGS